MVPFLRAARALCPLAWLLAFIPAQAGDVDPMSPAAFFPGGLFGLQLGSSWEVARANPAFTHVRCQPGERRASGYEVCFFKTAGRVLGAEIHEGFLVRQDERVVLIGTGIAIKNVDDPVAETVMRGLQKQVHARFRETGDDVLFANLPEERLSARQMQGFSQSAPVLLVELEPEETELAVLYGYLAPVNAFSALLQ